MKSANKPFYHLFSFIAILQLLSFGLCTAISLWLLGDDEISANSSRTLQAKLLITGCFLFTLSTLYFLKIFLKNKFIVPLHKLNNSCQYILDTKNFNARAEIQNNTFTTSLSTTINRLLNAIESSKLELKKAAYHDPLTQIPNRRQFWDYLKNSLNRQTRSHHSLALLLIDLDGFKKVNDDYGHHVGDSLLKVVSFTISKCLRQEDFLARIGGDEFTIILPDCQKIEDAGRIALKIIQALQQPFPLDGHDIQVGASIGISIAPGDTTNHKTLLQRADEAMYHAKNNGKNRYQFWNPVHTHKLTEQISFEDNLVTLIKNNELGFQFRTVHTIKKSLAIEGLELAPMIKEGCNTNAIPKLDICDTIIKSRSPRLLCSYYNWALQTLIDFLDSAMENHNTGENNEQATFQYIAIPVFGNKTHFTCFFQAFKYHLQQKTQDQSQKLLNTFLIQMTEESFDTFSTLHPKFLKGEIESGLISNLNIDLILDTKRSIPRITSIMANQWVTQVQINPQYSVKNDEEILRLCTLGEQFNCGIVCKNINSVLDWERFKTFPNLKVSGRFIAGLIPPHQVSQRNL